MDFRERLQSALGQTYVLQHELTGGGMARVYLAIEAGLGRAVVLKVLSSEMAAEVSAERFTREVQLAARLQHANIVPLLAAGTADGLPFYTMPYVEGESLRKRLLAGPLPVADVVSILRDVTRALGYAHSHGVVHRDIKPDNVLISGDAAVVTDFGIAKAIATAVADETSSRDLTTLTQLGMAIGTPAYMAPEQAAADPSPDRRADIYSLGVMAYELLTGETPFAGRTPQEMLHAKLTKSPRRVTELRSDVPPALATLVMRCLEHDATRRPQSAADVSAALAGVSGETSGSQRVRWPRRRITLGSAAAITLMTAALIGTRALGLGPWGSPLASGAVAKHGRVLVADFDGGRDSSLATTVTELFRIALAQSRSITPVDPGALGPALQRMKRPQHAVLDGATARELALREGMAAVVEGQILGGSGAYVLTAKLIAPHNGEVLASADETAQSAQDMIPAVGRLSSELRGELGESRRAVRETPPLERVTTTSLEALRKYTAALAADRRQDSPTSTALLREAVALDSTFAMAYRKLGNNLYWTLERPQAIEYLRRAYALRDRLTDTERNLLLGTYYSKVSADLPRAKAAFEAVLEVDPDNLIALDNAAYLAGQTSDRRRSEELYGRIAIRWPTTLAMTNLAEARSALGKFAAADSTYRAAIALSKPGENLALLRMGQVHFGAARQYDSAEVYLRRAVASSGVNKSSRVYAMVALAEVIRAQGRISEAAALLRDAAAIERGRGNPAGALLIELRTARATWWILGDRRAALRHVDSVRRQMVLLPGPTWSVNELAMLYARLDEPKSAREIVAAHARTVDKPFAVDLSADSLVAALILKTEGRTEDVIAILRRRNADCGGCHNAEMGFVFDQAGQADSAIASFTRHLDTYHVWRLWTDNWYLGPVYRRLGELHEAKGDGRRAAIYFTKLAELWKGADPVLQPAVREARLRAARLSGSQRT